MSEDLTDMFTYRKCDKYISKNGAVVLGWIRVQCFTKEQLAINMGCCLTCKVFTRWVFKPYMCHSKYMCPR